VGPDIAPRLPSDDGEARVGFLGVFASPGAEAAFRRWRFRDDLWLSCFLVVAGTLRVALLLAADFRHFGAGPEFWPLLASRGLLVLVSAGVLVVLRRAASPAAIARLFFVWAVLLLTLTVYSLSVRPPGSTVLVLMSFVVVVVTYCVTPLPLPRQALLALTYSAAVLGVSRGADADTLATVAAAHCMSHVFGAVMSWHRNHRQRAAYLGTMREAGLRARLETALAEVRTLRGLLCVCSWCKRIRDEAQVWHPVESYVQSRTHASFTHGICPDCLNDALPETSGPDPTDTAA
jgi:hypothetical protein